MGLQTHIRWDMIRDIKIPIEVFELRKLTPFENVAYYLTAALHLRQNEISYLLKRNPRTVWTILVRAEYKAAKSKSIDSKGFAAWERRVGIKHPQIEKKMLEAAQ